MAEETWTYDLRHEREREAYKGVCSNAGQVIYQKRSGKDEWMPAQWDKSKYELHAFQQSAYRNILICLECGRFIGKMAR